MYFQLFLGVRQGSTWIGYEFIRVTKRQLRLTSMAVPTEVSFTKRFIEMAATVSFFTQPVVNRKSSPTSYKDVNFYL